MIYVFVFIVVVAAAPFVREAMKPGMGASLHNDAPGEFAALSQGTTHYRWHGEKGGNVMVCVHGLTTPSYVWNQMMPHLTAAGYRVLTYDLYGRGFSDRPKGVQDAAFFLRQLRDLLAHEGMGDGFTLMGYSMGGSISASFAAAEPHRVGRMVLIAPAGMAHTPGWFANVVCRNAGVGDWLMLALGRRMLTKGASASAPGTLGVELAARQSAEAALRGYLPAVLSSQRGVLSEGLREEHRAITSAGVETLTIWGAKDDVIPLTAQELLAAWSAGAKQVVIEGAGHALAMTHGAEVSNAILG